METDKSTGMIESRPRASRGDRFLNFFVDFVCVGWGGFFLILVTLGDPIRHRFHVDIWEDKPGFAVLLGWSFLYYFIFETAFGRTLGKLISGTKVISREGEKPRGATIALRTLSRFVPFEPLSAFQRSQTCWHDDWTGTAVVKTR